MKRSEIAAIALLCVLSGSGWLLTQLYPGELGYPFSGCVHFVLIGLSGTWIWFCTGKADFAAKPVIAVVLAGIGVFALPAIALRIASGRVSEFFSVAVFCAIPVMTVLLLGAWSEDDSGGVSSRGLIAAVAGLGGALRLFPVDLPGSVRGGAFAMLLVLSCAATATACIWLHRLIQKLALPAVVSIVSFATAAVLAGYGVFVGWPVLSFHAVGVECLRCVVFDLPVVWLTVWLIREVTPQRLSARFLLAPLITAAESYAAMRGGVDLAAAIAMPLMAAGGIVLIVGNEPEEVPSLHLR